MDAHKAEKGNTIFSGSCFLSTHHRKFVKEQAWCIVKVKIELFGNNGQWDDGRKKGEELPWKNTSPTVIDHALGWCSGRYHRELFSSRGKNAFKDQKILEADITLSIKKLKMRRGWLPQQVNDPKHTSKSTMD